MLHTVSDTVPFTLLGQHRPDRARPVGLYRPGQPVPARPDCVYTTNVAVLDRAKPHQTPSVNGVLVMNMTLKKLRREKCWKSEGDDGDVLGIGITWSASSQRGKFQF